jgi:hypothetical protein
MIASVPAPCRNILLIYLRDVVSPATTPFNQPLELPDGYVAMIEAYPTMSGLIDFRLLLVCLLLIPNICSQLTFVEPPPPGNYNDYSGNPVFPYGTSVSVQWASIGTEGLKDINRLDLQYGLALSNGPPTAEDFISI